MAEYILSILNSQIMIVMSWRSHNLIAIDNGLKFKVQGFIHKGLVIVKYNEGTDLFDIQLLKDSGDVVKKIEGVYIDELVNVIDVNVKKVENYKERVKKEYQLKKK